MQNHLLNSLPAPQHIQTILNLVKTSLVTSALYIKLKYSFKFEDEIRTRLMHHKSVDRIRAISYAASYNDGTIYYIKVNLPKYGVIVFLVDFKFVFLFRQGLEKTSLFI